VDSYAKFAKNEKGYVKLGDVIRLYHPESGGNLSVTDNECILRVYFGEDKIEETSVHQVFEIEGEDHRSGGIL
jgi:hypothetical protein